MPGNVYVFVSHSILNIFLYFNTKILTYLCSMHWSLIIVWPKQKRGYILDSLMDKKTKDHYLFPTVVEKAFKVKFNWQMVKVHTFRFFNKLILLYIN